MPRKPAKKTQESRKSNIVAFKVEDDLAEFLNKLPNKSEFIRKAILAQFGMTCPLCTGSGVVPRGVHQHYQPVIRDNTKHPCEKCRTLIEIPLSVDAVAAGPDETRLVQFLHGGLLYCAKCYPTVPACDDCDWHVPHERVAEHFRAVHAHHAH